MTASQAPNCLELVGSTTSEEDGRKYIVGSIKNNCDRSFSHVTVLFKLDRTPGARVDMPEGGTYAYGRDVKPGDVQRFKSAVPIGGKATYRFDGIRAY